MGFVDRVASRAAEVRVVQVVLTVLALPFYVLGAVVAVGFLLVKWVYAAVLVGFADVTARQRVTDGSG